MARIESDFVNREKDSLKFEFVQNGFTEGVLILVDDIDRIEIQISREQFKRLKEFLKSKEIETF